MHAYPDSTAQAAMSAAPYSKDPHERFQALRMTGDCKGHSPATRAAMAWLITSTVPQARSSQLATWADKQLWEGAKAAHQQDPHALHTLPDSILESISWGEAVALLWGLREKTSALPIGNEVLAVIDAASPGFGSAIRVLAYEVDLAPFNELRWKFQNFVDNPFKPVFTNWLCLPWWHDQFCDDLSLEDQMAQTVSLLDL